MHEGARRARRAIHRRLLVALAAGAAAAEGLVVFPSECTLSTPESRQPLIVQEIERGEVGRQRATGAEWSSSDPKIATVADGVVTPVHDGRATITAKVGAQTATASVVVEGMSMPFAWSFRNHVEPLLAKAGVQLGCVPWRAGRQRRFPALAAGL